jgi:hypothetical protein
MKKQLAYTGALLTGCSLLLAVACGGDAGGTGIPSGTGQGGSSQNAGGNSSLGGSNNTGGSNTLPMGGQNQGQGGTISSAGGASGAAGIGNECASETRQAELIPLDLYLMIDTSGSMTENTSGGQTKWTAVRNALNSFLGSTEATGLGVGIQYFPIKKPNVPDTCTASSQCNGAGPCFYKGCTGTANLILCDNDNVCQNQVNFFSTCEVLGLCANDQSALCIPAVSPTCGSGAGACQQFQNGFCSEQTQCDASIYATPAVPISALPNNALSMSINSKQPEGNTPTSAALQGAIDRAKQQKMANPTHEVVSVLFTDGVPTACDPTDPGMVAAIAGGGYNGSPSIKTFVIGVFAPGEQDGPMTVNQIASQGGTKNAFVIDTSQDVTKAFLDALKEIRGSALACEYKIPAPKQGETLDYGKVNVEYTPPNGQPEPIPYVETASKCDPQTGGWYYDAVPSSTVSPTKIVMCDQTCSQFKTASGAVDIRLGCKTITMVPK